MSLLVCPQCVASRSSAAAICNVCGGALLAQSPSGSRWSRGITVRAAVWTAVTLAAVILALAAISWLGQRGPDQGDPAPVDVSEVAEDDATATPTPTADGQQPPGPEDVTTEVPPSETPDGGTRVAVTVEVPPSETPDPDVETSVTETVEVRERVPITPTLTPTPTETPTVTPTATPDPGPERREIGDTGEGEPIEVIRFGNGERVVVFIGGLHAGFAPATVELAEQLAAYLTDNPDEVPATATVYVVPAVNLDSPPRPGVLAGRLNANGVDLNRNWDCNWQSDAIIMRTVVEGSGGVAPFSEPETQALRDFLVDVEPSAVIFWEARATYGLASAGACGEAPLVSQPLAEIYGQAAEIQIEDFETFTNTILNGDAANWLDAQGIPTAVILLREYTIFDWESHLVGIRSVIDGFGR